MKEEKSLFKKFKDHVKEDADLTFRGIKAVAKMVKSSFILQHDMQQSFKKKSVETLENMSDNIQKANDKISDWLTGQNNKGSK